MKIKHTGDKRKNSSGDGASSSKKQKKGKAPAGDPPRFRNDLHKERHSAVLMFDYLSGKTFDWKNYETKFGLGDLRKRFAEMNWNGIVQFQENRMCLELVQEFYTGLVRNEKELPEHLDWDENKLFTFVRGVEIEMNSRALGKLLGIEYKGERRPPKDFDQNEAWNFLTDSEDGYPADSRQRFLCNFKVKVLHHFIGHSIWCKKSSMDFVSSFDLWLLNKFWKNEKVNIAGVILDSMKETRMLKNGKLFCGYGNLITIIADKFDALTSFKEFMVGSSHFSEATLKRLEKNCAEGYIETAIAYDLRNVVAGIGELKNELNSLKSQQVEDFGIVNSRIEELHVKLESIEHLISKSPPKEKESVTISSSDTDESDSSDDDSNDDSEDGNDKSAEVAEKETEGEKEVHQEEKEKESHGTEAEVVEKETEKEAEPEEEEPEKEQVTEKEAEVDQEGSKVAEQNEESGSSEQSKSGNEDSSSSEEEAVDANLAQQGDEDRIEALIDSITKSSSSTEGDKDEGDKTAPEVQAEETGVAAESDAATIAAGATAPSASQPVAATTKPKSRDKKKTVRDIPNRKSERLKTKP